MDLPLFLFALTLGALAGALAAWLAGRSQVARQRAETSLRDAFASLFSPEYKRRTIVNSLLFTVSIVGLWAGSIYVPAAVTQIAVREAPERRRAIECRQRPGRIGREKPCTERSSVSKTTQVPHVGTIVTTGTIRPASYSSRQPPSSSDHSGFR